MHMRTLIMALIVSSLTFYVDSHAGWMQDQLNAIKSTNVDSLKKTSLGDTKIADGLKEALRVGIDNAVKLTGKTDGYFKNDAIKIVLPKKLSMLDAGLRAAGFGAQIDEFVLSMNRSAEAAAPKARDIFIDGIMSMSFDDAMAIYKGGNTAATDFFKKTSTPKLREAFLPVIKKTLAQYNVNQKYDLLLQKYRTIPFSSKLPVPNVEDYILDQALNGLFVVLAQEESKIRTQPAARITDVLKQVF